MNVSKDAEEIYNLQIDAKHVKAWAKGYFLAGSIEDLKNASIKAIKDKN